jgi:hypothetical protein
MLKETAGISGDKPAKAASTTSLKNSGSHATVASGKTNESTQLAASSNTAETGDKPAATTQAATAKDQLIVGAHATMGAATEKHESVAGSKNSKNNSNKTAAPTHHAPGITQQLINEVLAAGEAGEKAANKPVASTSVAVKTPAAKETATHRNASSAASRAAKHSAEAVAVNKPAKKAQRSNAGEETETADNTAQQTTVFAKRERRVISKLILHERYVKTAPNDGYFRLDTVSMEELIREQEAGSENNYAASAPAKKHAGAAAKENETADNAEPAIAAAKEQAAPAVVPAAAAKEKTTAPKGISTAEKLSLAFNDIKNHVRGVQFAPGLTAGINSTFFGPAGFSGFQFGVTGEFVFSEAVSVKSELKYFNRINTSDYALKDEYFTYAQTGGQWYKYTNLQTASFSTMHSIELPISVRYTSGNFSFFAGGNAVYNFAIDADIPTMQQPGPAAVAAPAANEKGNISGSDFSSKFGFGYLFGMSYQVAPNFTLDLRNVQTLWDNSPTTGARTVSSQLYKHPSVQFSIGYRLGGHKPED